MPVQANIEVMMNPAPFASDDAYSMEEGGTLQAGHTIGVLSNDIDALGIPITAVLVSDAQYGDLALNADGSFTYTPDAGFTGNDTFTYRAGRTGAGDFQSLIATSTIQVLPEETLPPVPGATGAGLIALAAALAAGVFLVRRRRAAGRSAG